VPGVKIGVTTNLEDRVERQQGYYPDEYEVIMSTTDIDLISEKERQLQEAYGYKVDMKLYSKLKCNQMKINVTEMTTTFPCPVNKLKGRLIDNVGMRWQTSFGDVVLTEKSIDWIMQNVKSSQYTNERCYVYNRAFARWFDNNDAYQNMFDNAKQMNDVEKRNGTLTGGLAPTGARERIYCDDSCSEVTMFELIRMWADNRGLYDKGDPKTQYIKLIEEVGEIGRAILKQDTDGVVDGIGDAVVVLTNLAELVGVPIEECIEAAYDEIKNRTGKMVNGTFKKD
jgi:NTP pyrophosphatase (non-canonical NTP hydrolase)